MQNDLEKLSIIKEKIVKTDEVLKILLAKKNELAKQGVKYQSLLTHYSDKCKELERALKESNNISLEYRRIRSETQSLQAELSASKTNYESLESKYYKYVNGTELKFQTVNLELQNAEKKCEEQAKEISRLEKKISDLKSRQASPKKSPRKTEGKNNQIGKLIAKSAEINLRLNSALESDANKSKKIEELHEELRELQEKIKSINTSKYEPALQNNKDDQQVKEKYELRIANLTKQTKSLETENTSLKTKIRDIEGNNQQLKEKITELKFELGILNSEFNEKHLKNVFTQTDETSEQSEFEIDFMLSEMMSLPRLVSPLRISSDSDNWDDENFYKKHDSFYNKNDLIPPLILPENQQTIPEITVTPPTPVLSNFPDLPIAKHSYKTVSEGNIFIRKHNDQIMINNSKVNIIYNNEPINTKTSENDSARENKTLTLQMKCCYHSECNKYYSKVQIGDSNELELLGFEPVIAENKDNNRLIEIAENTEKCIKNAEKIIENKTEKHVVKRRPKQNVSIRKCSGMLYKRLLNDLHSMLSTNINKSSRKRTDERLRYQNTLRKTRMRKSRLRHINRQQFDRNNFENNDIDINYADNIYEIEQKSVDSGYSAHIASESEFSENMSVKNGVQDRPNETVKRKSSTDTQKEDPKKMKLDLFGSDSSSEENEDEKFGRNESEVRRKGIARKLSLRQRLQNIIQRERYGRLRIKEAESSKPPKRKFKTPVKNSKETVAEKIEEIFKKPAIEKLQQTLAEELPKPTVENSQKLVVENSQRVAGNLQRSAVENLQQTIVENVQRPCVENQQHWEAIRNIIGINTENKKESLKNEEKPSEVKTFKRPTCRRRFPDAPKSPKPEEMQKTPPKIIPLNKPKRLAKMAAKNLFDKLLNYPEEVAVLEEVFNVLGPQEPGYIAELIIQRVSLDYQDSPDMKFTPPAPIMTQTQRALLGLLTKLESQTEGVLSHFLARCERAILTEKRLECVSPLTRLYLAVAKMRGDIHRMRRTCLDALYFMGDLVVPFLYIVITCWGEVLPKSSENGDPILVKVLVQIVNIKDCNKPGYNLTNLRMILSQVYGYPDLDKRWNSDQMFAEIFATYRGNPTSREVQLAILIMCKNHSILWTYNQIEKHLKPVLKSSAEDPNLKLSVINLVDRISKCFNKKDDCLIVEKINQFLEGCKLHEEK